MIHNPLERKLKNPVCYNSTLINFVANNFVAFLYTCVSMLSVGLRVVMYFHVPLAFVLQLFVTVSLMR